MDNTDNPFRQVEGYHALRFVVPTEVVETVDEIFDWVSVSTSTFEANPEGTLWQVEILTEEPLEAEYLHGRLAYIAENFGIEAPAYQTEYIRQRDWVSEVQKSFPPIQAGSFFVYGSHYEGALPEGMIPILINAGQAFGSGEHETTSGCLIALDELAKAGLQFNTMLDLGSGSGILAIAMEKLWPEALVVATDIDPIAVDVCRENMEHNHAPDIKTVACAGYDAPLVAEHAPYDVIAANVLARPLIELAPDLEKHLAKEGIVILSGLLDRQEAEVVAAHEAVGLQLVKVFPKNGWHTLMLKRK